MNSKVGENSEMGSYCGKPQCAVRISLQEIPDHSAIQLNVNLHWLAWGPAQFFIYLCLFVFGSTGV
jgi:hypothetical protein